VTVTGTRDIDTSIELAAPPERVWRAISEAAEIAKWFAPVVRVTEAPERRLFVSWGEGMEMEVPITVVEPPRRLRHRFGENGDTSAPLWVDWTLEAGAGGASTTLRLVHSGFSAAPAWDEEFESTRRGWRVFLANLRHYVERHGGEPCVQRPFVLRVEASRDEVWRHIVSARGLDRDGTFATVPAGSAYHLTTSRGRRLEGLVQILEPSRDLALTLGDGALLRVSLELAKDGTMVYGVVLAYGDGCGHAADLAADIEAALRAALEEKDPPLSVRRQQL
jgi:uncharacterized protein YndB with AHSA1/START domain